MVSRVLFSSTRGDWETPDDVYKALDNEFHFTFDPCPPDATFDGLSDILWLGERVYCNPPYGPHIRDWLMLWETAEIAVYLLPSRTDTKWFHEIVLPHAKDIRFIKGRLKFKGSKASAPFPSMVVVFGGP